MNKIRSFLIIKHGIEIWVGIEAASCFISKEYNVMFNYMRGRQFTQKITLDKAVEICDGAIKNAKSLLDDAKLLFENGKYPRAISLAILSIEESGKPSIVRRIILEDDPKEISKLWKSYRKHQDKNSMWIVPELILDGARTLESLRKVVDPKSDHPQTLDNLKQCILPTKYIFQ